MQPSATFQNSAKSLTGVDFVVTQIEKLLEPFSGLPFAARDILSGAFNGDIPDTPKTMIPVRTISMGLGEILKEASATASSNLEGFRQFAMSLTGLIQERHRIDEPDIIRVTPRSVSSKFLKSMVDAESVHQFSTIPSERQKDLDIRMNHPDRVIYAWKDRYDKHGAIIHIEIALTDGVAKAIDPILKGTDFAKERNVATPYSVSNWRRVEKLISPFMYAVRERVLGDYPTVERAITLSPLTGFKSHVEQLPVNQADSEKLALSYIVGRHNFVGRAHLANGAQLVGVQPNANPQDIEAHGYMANYEYLSKEQGRKNAEAYRKGHPARTAEVDAVLQQNNYSIDARP